MGPDVRPDVRPSDTFVKLNWCDSGWWRYRLSTNWQCQKGNPRQCWQRKLHNLVGNFAQVAPPDDQMLNQWWPNLQLMSNSGSVVTESYCRSAGDMTWFFLCQDFFHFHFFLFSLDFQMVLIFSLWFFFFFFSLGHLHIFVFSRSLFVFYRARRSKSSSSEGA